MSAPFAAGTAAGPGPEPVDSSDDVRDAWPDTWPDTWSGAASDIGIETSDDDRAQLAPWLLAAASALVLAAIAGGIVLLGKPSPAPLAGLAIAFLAGVGAMAILRHVDIGGRRAADAAELKELRRQTEALDDLVWELRESDDRHRSVINALGDIIYRRDAAGRIIYANETFARCFGIDPARLGGEAFRLPRADLPGAPEDALPGTSDLALQTTAGPRWFRAARRAGARWCGRARPSRPSCAMSPPAVWLRKRSLRRAIRRALPTRPSRAFSPP